MKYVLLTSSLILATMSISQAYTLNDHQDIRQHDTFVGQNIETNAIGIVEAFSLIPNLSEFEFNASDLNNDKKLNRSELHILSQYNS